MKTAAAIFAFIAIAFVAIVTAVTLGATYYIDRGRCSTWGAATNRETKFVHLNELIVPLTWDCFTPDQDGRWIPIGRVRDID